MQRLLEKRLGQLRSIFIEWHLATDRISSLLIKEDVSKVLVRTFNKSIVAKNEGIALSQIAYGVFICVKLDKNYSNRVSDDLYFAEGSFLFKESLDRLVERYGSFF